MAVPVTIENFTRAETDRMFAALQAEEGGVNRLRHDAHPDSDRPSAGESAMNRDTALQLRGRRHLQGCRRSRSPDGGSRQPIMDGWNVHRPAVWPAGMSRDEMLDALPGRSLPSSCAARPVRHGARRRSRRSPRSRRTSRDGSSADRPDAAEACVATSSVRRRRRGRAASSRRSPRACRRSRDAPFTIAEQLHDAPHPGSSRAAASVADRAEQLQLRSSRAALAGRAPGRAPRSASPTIARRGSSPSRPRAGRRGRLRNDGSEPRAHGRLRSSTRGRSPAHGRRSASDRGRPGACSGR